MTEHNPGAPETNSDKPDRLDAFMKNNPWALPVGIGALVILAIVLVLFLTGVLGGGDEESGGV